MAIIAPQLHRCQKLRVDVSFSSSLPSFPGSFHGEAPLLEELQLECDFDDSEEPIDSPETRTVKPFQCPALWKLNIDGRNFYNAWEDGNDVIDFPAVTDLAISRFTGYPNPFSLQNLLFTLCDLPNLTRLRLTDLEIDPLDDVEFLGPLFLSSVVCEDIHDVEVSQFLIEYFGAVDRLTLTRCAIGDATCEAEALSLKEIGDDLDDFLRCWVGRNLYLDNCSSLDDALLEMMSVPDVETSCMIAPLMEYLDISNCLDFSVPALKRFVESRERGSSHGYDCMALEGMRISGQSPYFSPEDILWFEEHLSFVLIPACASRT